MENRLGSQKLTAKFHISFISIWAVDGGRLKRNKPFSNTLILGYAVMREKVIGCALNE